MIRIAIIALLSALLFAKAQAADQSLESDERGVNAQARPSYSLDARPRINRLDFDFPDSESRAWLIVDGNFSLHGWVRHRSLLCATYQMGVRFGIGAPGCLSVEWISDPVFVTSHVQCNGARVEHAGGDVAPEMGAVIDKISCAERVIRCSGSCK